MKKYEFKAKIIKHDKIDAAYVRIPFDVEKEFNKKGQIKVKAYFNDYEYRGSLVKMGQPFYFIGLSKKIRNIINKGPGDIIKVLLSLDIEERKIEVPEEINKFLFNHTEEKNFFEKLSYSHKKEYIEWITSAKKDETKTKRLNKFILMLQTKKKSLN